MIYRLILKFFDYQIIGEYYDICRKHGKAVYTKKYLKKWRLRKGGG